MGFGRCQGGGATGFNRAQGTPSGFAPAQGAGSAAFVPTDISGLAAWYDASVIGTLWQDSGRTTPVTTLDHPIGAWDDRSGNARHLTQGTAGNKPRYKTSVFGSLSGVDFVTDDFLKSSLFTVNQPDTIFMVLDVDTVTDAIMFDAPFGGTRQVLLMSAADWLHYATNSVGGGAPDTNPHILISTMTGASSKLRVDGGADVSGAANPGTNALGGVQLGIETNGAALPFDGRIAEVLVYDSALSTANIDRVGNYLGTKWGITYSAAS